MNIGPRALRERIVGLETENEFLRGTALRYERLTRHLGDDIIRLEAENRALRAQLAYELEKKK